MRVIAEEGIEDMTNGVYICNYTDTQSGGTHWYVIDFTNLLQMNVFDPLGAPVDDTLEEYARKINAMIRIGTTKAQADKSNMCGLWSIWFISIGCDVKKADLLLSKCSTFAKKEAMMISMLL